MSNYNEYAQRLNSAFDAAATKQREALEAYYKVQNKAKAASNSREKQDAAEQVKQEKAQLDATTRDAWKEFRESRDTIGKELRTAVNKSAALNPDDVDGNALSVLNSSMLTASDLDALAGQYKGNNTMLRAIGAKADEMAKTEKNKGTRRRLRALSSSCERNQTDKLAQWDNLCTLSQSYSGETRDKKDPGYICAINEHWRDANVQAAIHDF